MINIECLNKEQTYIGLQVGNGTIANLIQSLSQKQTDLPREKIASHVLALVYLEDWYVFEAHMRHKGCKKILFSEWIESENLTQFEIYERDLNIDILEYYANPLFNPGYSMAEISNFAIAELTSLDFWNDKPGMVCSEYVANADKEFKISYKTKLKCNKIKPVHWQVELMKG